MTSHHTNIFEIRIYLPRDLAQALKMRDWSNTDPIRKREFEGSVFFTSGIFNVMMSLLPPRVTKRAEIVGFHGDRVQQRSIVSLKIDLIKFHFRSEGSAN